MKDTKSDYTVTMPFLDKRTGDVIYVQLQVDTYALLEHMAKRAIESKTGVATAKAGSLRVSIVGRKRKDANGK